MSAGPDAGGVYRRRPLVQGERTHRRGLLLALSVLLLLSMGPIFGHHFPSGVDAYLAGRDYVWALCLVALHLLMEPVHGLFHSLFFVGLGYAIWDRASARLSMHRIIRHLETAPVVERDPFWTAAQSASVPPRDLRVVSGLPTPAFTVGWFRPKIFVAAELADRLTPAELTAVLAHEGAHVARRDPLRLSALRFLACLLFWIRAMRELADDIADDAEIRADDAAARDHPLALASALVSLARWTQSSAVRHAVGFNQRDLLERRVRRLAGEQVPPSSRLSRRSIAWAAAALALAWLSGPVMAHPLPADSPAQIHKDHCDHTDSAFSHLFCAGLSLAAHPAVCPHSSTERA